ncbi:hypothetical protein [Acidicapsa acidisoli]|uniref:hypothetical protein n=1 Tax=Acidicapsa acidisoli TaxID=1615681 RepID=UPI0021DF901C|nr:hypothetical protein [Acidicapsa acidisoli]
MQCFKALLVVTLVTIPYFRSSAQVAAPVIEGLTLDAAMKLIQDKMNAQGPVQYHLYNLDEKGARKVPGTIYTISQSSFAADASACRINYHVERHNEPEVPNALLTPSPLSSTNPYFYLKSGAVYSDGSTVAITPESVSVIDAAERWHLLATDHRHPDWAYETVPQVFIARVRLGQTYSTEIYVHEKADAEVVAKAMQRAIQLCNPSAGKDPF